MSQQKPTTRHETDATVKADQVAAQRETDAAREAAQNQPTPLVPGKAAKEPDAPILAGHEGPADQAYETVTLIGGGPGDGRYRVKSPLPQAVASNSARYLKSTADTYVWQVP
jgi:hypothetical protein